MQAQGVTCAFGVPGTQTLALYEGIRRSRIRSVLATNELAAGFMANGYYRASGRIAPLLTIPGPGFTWALTAVAEALHDSVALIHLAGCTPTADSQLHLQAIDQQAVAAPLVKGTLRLSSADDVEREITRAFQLALSGEPGPVLVEWTREALEGAVSKTARPPPTGATTTNGTASAADDVARLLLDAKRPLLLVGQGSAAAAGPLRELAELLHCPVFATASGRGILPEDHELCLGFDIERGNVALVNELIESADSVLALGCKLGYSGSGGFQLRLPAERLVRVDTSSESRDSTYPAKLTVIEDVAAFLARLLPRVRAHEGRKCGWSAGEIQGATRRLREVPEGIAEPAVVGSSDPSVGSFFGALRRALPRDGIVVADSGLHQQLLRRHFEVLAPRGLLFPSDFQSMGFGLPAAIGAKLAEPQRRVVAVIGDGGFAMSGMELLTAVREGLSLTVVVLCDGLLGRIRLEQLAAVGRTTTIELLNPDFRAFAAAVGAAYASCEAEPEAALRRAIDADGVTVVELRLKDTPRIQRVRATGLLRGAARRVLGPDWIRSLKRMVKRGE
jgi:acetolactate synthase-1/2/3 large subunit